MKDQPSTKLIQMNACIIKPRILSNYPLPKPVPLTTNQPRTIRLAQPIPPLPPLHPIPLAPLASIPFQPFAPTENNF
ncbi:MAG: hypothetical protein WBQ25_25905 [Nitrososphaeraceae archaeon]